MAKNSNKVLSTQQSVSEVLSKIEHPKRLEDSKKLVQLFEEATSWPAVVWDGGFIGFGEYHYRYESGREGDSAVTGFIPRKTNLTLFIATGLDNHAALLKKLGKHRTGKSCLYVNKLDDIHLDVLKKLIQREVAQMRTKYHLE